MKEREKIERETDRLKLSLILSPTWISFARQASGIRICGDEDIFRASSSS